MRTTTAYRRNVRLIPGLPLTGAPRGKPPRTKVSATNKNAAPVSGSGVLFGLAGGDGGN